MSKKQSSFIVGSSSRLFCTNIINSTNNNDEYDMVYSNLWG